MNWFPVLHRPLRLAWGLGMILIASATAGAAIPPNRLETAINKARQYLLSQEKPGGHWEKDGARKGTDHDFMDMQGDTYGGYTALATYALLAAGESPNDPKIKEAVEFLKHCDMVGVYAVAMRCQVWLLIPHNTPEMKDLIRKDADFLFAGINDGKQTPENKGMWDYLGKGARVDHSVSQYGVLGLWACQQTGVIDVGAARWKLLEEPWRAHQTSEGGWDYSGGPTAEASMTAAGVASLFIIGDYLHADAGALCKGNAGNPAIERGLDWIDKNYNSIGDDAYTLYGIERIGTASGYGYFAGHNWFNDISERLLKAQHDDGSWMIGGYAGAEQISSTSFILLFLARGRAPVMVNKLDYRGAGGDTSWNERPRDIANLSSWVGHQTETYMNWQIVNLQANPDDLHDAPVLYLSGSSDIKLNDDQAQRIKRFVDQGGMVLANADCGRESFARSVIALGESLFGKKFRELPAGHPAYVHEQFPATRWRERPKVLGLSNGVRELMIIITNADPARWWQVPTGANAHEDLFELGADLFQYACDRKIWAKGAGYFVAPDPAAAITHKVKLARLQLPNTNWDPEPGGWRQMAALLHNQDGTDLSVFTAIPGKGGLSAAQVAHLTGTGDFTLSDNARLELQTFVSHGGTLVVDAAGGSAAFAAAAERELPKVFGESAAQELQTPLPPNHPVFTLASHPITTFDYRPWARLHRVGNLKAPRIRAISVGNRPAVFYSPDDLSAGLVGEPVDGVFGYEPQTAINIMRNIILYSSEGKHT